MELEPKPTSRRAFFFFGALAALAPARAAAQKVAPRRDAILVPRSRFQTIAQREAPAAPASWRDTTTRLVRRATYAALPEDLALAKRLGYQSWLSQQLKYTKIRDDAVDAAVATMFPLLSQTGEQMYAAAAGVVQTQLQQATVYRAVFSRRQLYERMVEFWSDHFNIYIPKVGYLKAIDDRDVIRRHALGRFGDLLKASAKSGAMLAYLDQTQSRVGRPNENYARELMELYTVGVDGGYTQNDVAQLARVLTGWTIRGRGEFYFDPSGHDWTAKTVMGVTIPAGSPALGQEGIKEGERMLDFLIAHPSTARFISTKMLQWLLTSEPSESQIRTISGVYRSTGGDISAMVRAILNDGWMATAPARYKRPFHFLVSGVRALNATVTSPDLINRQLGTLGQPLFIWDTPDGYPDKVEFWAGNITPRWSVASTLANYRTGTVIVDAAPYMVSGVDGTIDALNQRVFASEMSPSVRTALRAFLAGGAFTDTRVRETISLALASSDFQWY